jgi:hypothetical protein
MTDGLDCHAALAMTDGLEHAALEKRSGLHDRHHECFCKKHVVIQWNITSGLPPAAAMPRSRNDGRLDCHAALAMTTTQMLKYRRYNNIF